MLKISRIVIVVVLVSALTAVVHADMVHFSKLNVENNNYETVCKHQDCQCADLFNSVDFYNAIDFHPLSGQLPSNINNNIREVSQGQNSLVLKDESSSLLFCLSALIGMGFCSSAHWMKKHSLGFIPEWYHSGGPHQIGHSFAVNPDLLLNAPTPYFIEPVYSAEDSFEKYHLRKIVISLWRNSQFTPDIIASRAPPNMS